MAKVTRSVRGRKYTFTMDEDSNGHKGEIKCPVCKTPIPVSHYPTAKSAVESLESEFAFHLQLDHPNH